jgi:hypothetical protein
MKSTPASQWWSRYYIWLSQKHPIGAVDQISSPKFLLLFGYRPFPVAATCNVVGADYPICEGVSPG